MVIPKKFQLGGLTITVEKDSKDDLKTKEHVWLGEYDSILNRILISLSYNDKTLTRKNVEVTFLHELWHAIWVTAGDNELADNEKRADLFAQFMLQFFNTSKGQFR